MNAKAGVHETTHVDQVVCIQLRYNIHHPSVPFITPLHCDSTTISSCCLRSSYPRLSPRYTQIRLPNIVSTL
ncbi:hypothetical protein BDY19DRAFT_976265 [Irpex rosettiformis]|uniref:Uncharacterized protein n=1 Tax=Irpex rosettiformis TaxID=378272 RepID=A0ACB8TP24_9APHY|nr:hypothetical protein BDY19DRAFT_976265 [Irpex rosettiformis]